MGFYGKNRQFERRPKGGKKVVGTSADYLTKLAHDSRTAPVREKSPVTLVVAGDKLCV